MKAPAQMMHMQLLSAPDGTRPQDINHSSSTLAKHRLRHTMAAAVAARLHVNRV
jgi:hypothetical protein